MVIPKNGQSISKIDRYLTDVHPKDDDSIHRAKLCPLCARTIVQAGIRNVYLRLEEDMDDHGLFRLMSLNVFRRAADRGGVT